MKTNDIYTTLRKLGYTPTQAAALTLEIMRAS